MFERTRKAVQEIIESFRKDFQHIQTISTPITLKAQVFEESFGIEVRSMEASQHVIAHHAAVGTIAQESVELSPVEVGMIQITTHQPPFAIASSALPIHEGAGLQAWKVQLRSQVLSRQPCYVASESLPRSLVTIKDPNILFRSIKLREKSVGFLPRLIRNPPWFRTITMTRRPAARSDYNDQEIQKGLRYIMKRLGGRTKFKVLGVYRDIPIDRIERIQFQGKDLQFTLKEPGVRDAILDVIIVRDEEEKRYHVGPIVRKA